MDPPDCLLFKHIRFYFLVFSVLHLLVVGSVRQIKPTHVGFRAHVKIASRIVSYRSYIYELILSLLFFIGSSGEYRRFRRFLVVLLFCADSVNTDCV